MVEKGLEEAGYNYVVIDGGWRDVKLGPNGEMLTHPERYPKGVKWLADYAHAKGLKFGLHIVPGPADCGGGPSLRRSESASDCGNLGCGTCFF